MKSLSLRCRVLCSAFLAGLAVPLSSLAAAPAANLTTRFVSFVDVNNNGLLDCGEPVTITVSFASLDPNAPPFTGTLDAPYAGGSTLVFLPGTVTVDSTTGCSAQITQGNTTEDPQAEIQFSCAQVSDVTGNQLPQLTFSYQAGYASSDLPQLTDVAHVTTSNGVVLTATDTHSATGATCAGKPNAVKVTKTSAGDGSPGSRLVYTIVAQDLSGLGQGGVQFTDEIPPHTTFDPDASSPGWSCPAPTPGSLCRLSVGNIDRNQSITRFFAVRIDSTLPAGVANVTNTACVRGGPVAVLGCGGVSTPTTGHPQLKLAKSFASGNGAPGSTLTYTLSVANLGNQDSSEVVLTEVVPSNTTLSQAASSAGWSCSPGPNPGATCTLTLAGIAVSSSSSATFGLLIANPLPAGTTEVANTACATTPGTPKDCSTISTPTTGMPSLSLHKSVSGTAVPGATLTYDLALQNTGNEGAASISVTETVPGFTTFSSAGSSPGWTCSPGITSGSTCTLSLPTLAGGSTVHLNFAVTVINPLPANAAGVKNTACATSPGLKDSCDSLSVPTAGAPNLTLSKTYSGGAVLPSAVLLFQLTLKNSGNQDARPLTVTDKVPALSTFVLASSSPGWSCSPDTSAGSTCTLHLTGLAAGASSVLTYAVRAASTLPPAAVIQNAACAVVDPLLEAVAKRGAAPTSGAAACSNTATPPALAIETSLAVAVVGHPAPALAGDRLHYTLTIPNATAATITNVATTVALDPNTSLVPGSVATSAGTVGTGNAPGDTTVTVLLGDLAPSQKVIVEFEVQVKSGLPADVKSVAAQAQTVGGNIPADPSDDPATPEDDDPTAVAVLATASPIQAIPTLSEIGLIVLTLCIATYATLLLRRRTAPAVISPPPQ